METSKTYENFPVWIVLLSNLGSAIIYIAGIILMFRLGLIPAMVYLLLIMAFEYRLLSSHCINCYYFGKTCGFGKGVISSMLFKGGDPSKFCNNTMSWKDLIPDLLLSLIPVITGIILMIIEFDVILLLAVTAIITVTTVGNGFIRGKLTCKYCRQRESGCPAEKMFRGE